MSELRFDRQAGALLHLAPEHPRGLAPLQPLRGPTGCPLCPGGPALQGPRLAQIGDCFATPMGRPSLRVEARSGFHDLGPFEVSEGLGAHELLLPQLPHGAPPRALGADGWAALLGVGAARMQDLRGDRRLGPMALSLGWRAECGARVDHLHAQLHAFPVELEGRLPPAPAPSDSEDPRLEVLRVDDLSLRCPPAPGSPLALQIVPEASASAFERQDSAQLGALAAVLQEALERLHRAIGERPLSLGLWSRPGQPWTLQLRPWIRPQATLQQALGLAQHELAPERAAEALRAAVRV